MTKSNPEAFVNQLFTFKDFLVENVGDVTVIIGVVFVSLFVFLFALREILTWLTRTNLIKNQLSELSNEICDLKLAIKNLESRESLDVPKASKNIEQSGFKIDKSTEKPPSFPLGY